MFISPLPGYTSPCPVKKYEAFGLITSNEAHFPVQLWSQFDKIVGTRKNNHLEFWHATLNRHMNRPHLKIFRLTEVLQSEQQKFEDQRHFIQTGDPVSKQHASYWRVAIGRYCFLKDWQATKFMYMTTPGAEAGALKESVIHN